MSARGCFKLKHLKAFLVCRFGFFGHLVLTTLVRHGKKTAWWEGSNLFASSQSHVPVSVLSTHSYQLLLSVVAAVWRTPGTASGSKATFTSISSLP